MLTLADIEALFVRRGHEQYSGEPVTQLLASNAGDSTFAVVGRMERTIRVENARWYVTDDRFTYKPGEKAYVKGWVRWTDNGHESIVFPGTGTQVVSAQDHAK